MRSIAIHTLLVLLVTAAAATAQRPPRPDGRPGQEPPFGGDRMPPRPEMGDRGPRGGWLDQLDANRDGVIDAAEFQQAIERTFAHLDRDGNGAIEQTELAPPPPRGERGPGPEKKLLPPFFFDRELDTSVAVSKAAFTAIVQKTFARLDENHDGVLDRSEADRGPRGHDDGRGGPGGPPPPNARFIAAELRFGDRLVKDQPFSAETVIEDTRRLFDGSTVTKTLRGAIYRDFDGRTRREQPLEMIAGVQVAGSDGKPLMMIFINDFTARTQTFLDANSKIARSTPLDASGGSSPLGPPAGREGESTESLGTKTIDGLKVEGTRVTFNIPAGQLGNDRPMAVVTENWYSPELQMIVMSRRLDPIAGEHVFRLTNIKRAEPAGDLFKVPGDYKIETGRGRRDQ